MKCNYCQIDIHPANLTYVDNEPHHFICVALLEEKNIRIKSPVLYISCTQWAILGIVGILGIIGVRLAFKLGYMLARRLLGL